MKLWPKPVVRPIRFHDLRHTTATLTEAVCGHVETGYLRTEVNRLKRRLLAPSVLPPKARRPVPWVRELLDELTATPAMNRASVAGPRP